jgi:hypothetical protein
VVISQVEAASIMKKYSIIHVPILSFFSKALYRDVGLNWKGVGFGYLLLLLAVCWIPPMVKIHRGFAEFVENEAPAVVNQVPEITITDGQASIQEPQPYYIKAPDSNNVLAVIDTTGSITSLEDANAFCLLTEDSVMWQKSQFETQTMELSEVKSFTLDSDRIMGWLRTAEKFIAVIMYPFALLGEYAYRIAQVLIYAAIGLLFASWCKVSLSYPALLRLAVVAVTPCIIVSTVIALVGTTLPCFLNVLYLVAALAYLFLGVKACSEPSQIEQEHRPPQQMEI